MMIAQFKLFNYLCLDILYVAQLLHLFKTHRTAKEGKQPKQQLPPLPSTPTHPPSSLLTLHYIPTPLNRHSPLTPSLQSVEFEELQRSLDEELQKYKSHEEVSTSLLMFLFVLLLMFLCILWLVISWIY